MSQLDTVRISVFYFRVSQTELPHCLGKLQSPLGKQQVYSLIVEVSGRGRPAFLLHGSPQHQGTTLFYISSRPSFTSLRSPELSGPLFLLTSI